MQRWIQDFGQGAPAEFSPQNLLKIGIFALKLPKNCTIFKKKKEKNLGDEWARPLDPLVKCVMFTGDAALYFYSLTDSPSTLLLHGEITQHCCRENVHSCLSRRQDSIQICAQVLKEAFPQTKTSVTQKCFSTSMCHKEFKAKRTEQGVLQPFPFRKFVTFSAEKFFPPQKCFFEGVNIDGRFTKGRKFLHFFGHFLKHRVV